MEVRGLPEERTGGETAVRLAGRPGRRQANRLGGARIGDGGVPEDGGSRPERGVAGAVGRVEAMRPGGPGNLEREGPRGDGRARAGVGEDAR